MKGILVLGVMEGVGTDEMGWKGQKKKKKNGRENVTSMGYSARHRNDLPLALSVCLSLTFVLLFLVLSSLFLLLVLWNGDGQFRGPRPRPCWPRRTCRNSLREKGKAVEPHQKVAGQGSIHTRPRYLPGYCRWPKWYNPPCPGGTLRCTWYSPPPCTLGTYGRFAGLGTRGKEGSTSCWSGSRFFSPANTCSGIGTCSPR